MLFVLDLPLGDTFMIYILFYFGRPISIFIDIDIEYGRCIIHKTNGLYLYKEIRYKDGRILIKGINHNDMRFLYLIKHYKIIHCWFRYKS